jgi:transcriptional regulator
MYDIPYFKAANHQEVLDFMQANPFVTICGVDANGLPIAAQIPILIKHSGEKLIISGHLMRKQDHTNAFEKNNNVLVIFSAPSAFVSASWYTQKGIASTWNYQTVHAVGKMAMKDDAHLLQLLTELTLHFEKDANAPTHIKNLDTDYVQQNMKAIVSFDIEVTDLKNVFKLSQNRDEVSYANIQKELEKGDAACKYMAAAMQAQLNPRDSHTDL